MKMFTTRTIIGLVVLAILLVGLSVGVYLSQRQTQLKSRASEDCPDKIECTNSTRYSYSQGFLVNREDGPDYCSYGGVVNMGPCVDGSTTPAPTAPAGGTTSNQSPCPLSNWNQRSNDDLIRLCSLGELAGLPNDRLETFPLDTIVKFPNDRLDDFSLIFLAKLPNDRLLLFPNEQLMKFSIPVLERFGNERLITFSLEVLRQFPLSRIHTFPCDVQIKIGYELPSACVAGGVTPTAPPATTPPAENGEEASTCNYEILDTKTLGKIAPNSLISGNAYKVRIEMKNTGKTMWTIDKYILFPSPKTISSWSIGNISLAQSTQGINVVPGSSALFEFEITAPTITDNKARTEAFYFQMANGTTPFGSACSPQDLTIAPPNSATACIVASEVQEDVTAVTKCDDAVAKEKGIIQTSDLFDYTLKDTKAGLKTIYIRFISVGGEVKDTTKNITYSPAPALEAIACTHSATGTGTVIAIKGTNFGTHVQQGQGKVTVKGVNAKISSWDPTTGIILATVPEKLEGDIPVDLKIDDGRVISGSCTVGITNVSFAVNDQCTTPGGFSVNDLNFAILENISGAKAIASGKTNVSKGVPQSLDTKIQAGKKYQLFTQAPRTLIKKTDFTADQGTKNLGQILLTIGDIAPRSAPDGKINALDKSEMTRQWNLLGGGTELSADLNGDGSVNSLDYSCQKIGFNKENEAPASVFTGQ